MTAVSPRRRDDRPETSPAEHTVCSGVPERLAVDMTVAEQHDYLQTTLRRSPVSRRSVLVTSLVGTAAAAMAGNPWTQLAYAADAPLLIGGRHVAFGEDASTQLRFAAQLSRDPGTTKVYLEHGLTPFFVQGSVEAEVRHLHSAVPQLDGTVLNVDQFYLHAEVKYLLPQLDHYYRWRTSDGYTTPVEKVATAHIRGRLGGRFRFTMMADQGSNDTPKQPAGLQPGDYDDNYYKPDNAPAVPHAANITKQVVKANPAFHLLAGDISYADPSGSGSPLQFVPHGANPTKGFDKYDPFVWDAYLASIEPSAKSTPWMFATGNHDMEALYSPHGYGGHTARLDLPGSGPVGCPSVYSFVYGNVAVLSLDANDVSYEIQANKGYSGGAQGWWVEDQLRRFRADRQIDFIVCFFHHCAYSTTLQHASDGGVRDSWGLLFDSYQVDLVLQGHNHVYERTDPIKAGSATKAAPDGSTIYPATDGTTYAVVGCGGRPRYAFQAGEPESYRGHVAPGGSNVVPNSYVWNPDGTKQTEQIDWSRVRFENYALVVVDVIPGFAGFAPSVMRVSAVDENGTEFDRFTLSRAVPAINFG